MWISSSSPLYVEFWEIFQAKGLRWSKACLLFSSPGSWCWIWKRTDKNSLPPLFTIKAWYLRAMPARVSPSSTTYLWQRISDPEQQFIGRQYCNKDKSHLVLSELLTQWNLSNCWRHRCMCRSCAEKSNLPAIDVHSVPWVGIKSSNSVSSKSPETYLTRFPSL